MLPGLMGLGLFWHVLIRRDTQRPSYTFSDYRYIHLYRHIKGTTTPWTMRACGKIAKSLHFRYIMLALWPIPLILVITAHHLSMDTQRATWVWRVVLWVLWTVGLPALLTMYTWSESRYNKRLVATNCLMHTQHTFIAILAIMSTFALAPSGAPMRAIDGFCLSVFGPAPAMMFTALTARGATTAA
jgi:hypothetical protein